MVVSAERPPLLTEWQTYEQALAWLERLRALLEQAGVWTDELQRALGRLAGGLLVAAAGATPSAATDHTPQPRAADVSPRHVEPDVPVAPTGDAAEEHEDRGVTVHERLQALGYPQELSRSERIRLGQAVVAAYKGQHGTSPLMVTNGSGAAAHRTARYTVEDIALIDRVLRETFGPPPFEARGG